MDSGVQFLLSENRKLQREIRDLDAELYVWRLTLAAIIKRAGGKMVVPDVDFIVVSPMTHITRTRLPFGYLYQTVSMEKTLEGEVCESHKNEEVAKEGGAVAVPG